MGKYLISSMFLFSCIFLSESFKFNLFNLNKLEIPLKIQKESNKITIKEKHIFNPFEKTINFPFIESVDSSDIIKQSNRPIYMKPVTEIINDIKQGKFNVLHQNTQDIDIANTVNYFNFDEHKHEISKSIVKYSSSLLPTMDGIAHHVLSMNQNFINFVLDNEHLTIELKKKLVLLSIQLAQNGDNMGSSILEFYYNIVNHLL